MTKLYRAILIVASVVFVSAGPAHAENDTYQWLESTTTVKARDWVRAQNERTLQILAKDPRYTAIEAEMRAILTAKDRLPYPHLRAGWVYNFWQDGSHPRGIWRRARPDAYAKPNANWEILLDLDRYDADQKQDWTWQGETCLAPSYDRCVVQLSHGGKDEVVIREFDVEHSTFVANGFNLPEAVSNISWIDTNHILVDSNFGAGTVLRSGYSRIVKLWTRGEPLSNAKTVLEGADTDLWDTSMVDIRPEAIYPMVVQFLSRSRAKYSLLLPDYHLARVPLPEDANVQSVFNSRLFAILRSPWKGTNRTLPAGTVVAYPLMKIDDPHPEDAVELVYSPDDRSSVEEFDAAQHEGYLNVLHNVRSQLFRIAPSSAGWSVQALGLPELGTIKILSANDFDDMVYVSYESFLTPPSVYSIDGAQSYNQPTLIAALPERFNGANFAVEQNEAISTDGTHVPYFLVLPKDTKFDGSQPILLFGYGGFESSLTPTYLDTVGKAWLERGGAYALANVRGGGEFGPSWYLAAKAEKRQKSFDDFLAVAEDMIHRKVTSPRRLGIMGSSQGGLLVGASMTQRPELFHAVVCQVPFLDMMNYTRIGAGAAWVAEYGDPGDPNMAKVLRSFSPYQNVRRGVRYPATLFEASTEDDRVHPAHARKMAALLKSIGNDVFYYEDEKSGHQDSSSAIDSRIRRRALEFVFLLWQLKD